MQPRVLILRAPGTNCDGETTYAFQRACARPEIVHVRRLLESPRLLGEFQIFCIPGGFSYGDDIASGRILAVQMQQHLGDALREFTAAEKLILGICNGFQVLLRCGLLAGNEPSQSPQATLTSNASGKFEDRWVRLTVAGDKCVFLTGIQQMDLPLAHGEGRFVARDGDTLERLNRSGQLVLRYGDPENPQAHVAGMCDVTGRIFGLMPHPERHVDPAQHPRWTRGVAVAPAVGLRLFQNAVDYFR